MGQIIIVNPGGGGGSETDPLALKIASNLSDLQSVATAKSNLSLVKADVGLGNVDNTSDADKPIAIQRTTQANLTCNFASTNYIIATVTGNQSFTLSNVPTDQVVTILVINTGGGDITLPNTADKYSAGVWTHSAGGIREYSLLFDGTTRYWQVSEELV